MQRSVVWVCTVSLFAAVSRAESPVTRQGVALNLKSFPQATPKEALASVLKAAELKRFDYILAQLAEPEWVDRRAELEGFKEMIQETAAKLDASAVKQLKRFLEEGEIETLDTRVVIRLKDVKNRVVRLRKIDNRWYLLQANKP